MRYIIALTFLCALSFSLNAGEKASESLSKLKAGAWAEYEITLPKKPRSEVLYEIPEQPKDDKKSDDKKDDKADAKKDKKDDKPKLFTPKQVEKLICRIKVVKINKGSINLVIKIGFTEKNISIDQSIGDVSTIFASKSRSYKKYDSEETKTTITIKKKKINVRQIIWNAKNVNVEKWESKEVPFELVRFKSGLFKMKLINYGWK